MNALLFALRRFWLQRTGTNGLRNLAERSRGEFFPGALHEPERIAPFTPLATGIPSQPGTTSYTDSTATNASPVLSIVWALETEAAR